MQDSSCPCADECSSGVCRVRLGLQHCKDGQRRSGSIINSTQGGGEVSGKFGVEGFADKCDFPSLLTEKLGERSSLPRQTLEELFKFVYNSLSGDQALQAEAARGI